MTCGVVHASYSLPEWQAVKLPFLYPEGEYTFYSTGTNLSFMCKAVTLLLKPLLLKHLQPLKFIILTSLFVQETNNLLLLLFYLSQILPCWVQKADT